MSYVPPHKRQSHDKDKPLPSPEFPPPHTRSNRNLVTKFSNSRFHSQKPITNISYARHAISTWFVVDPNHRDFPSRLNFHPISLDSLKHQHVRNPHILLCSNAHLPQPQVGYQERKPWEVIADKTLQNLLHSFENVRAEIMEAQHLEQVKPTLVARLGKIIFHGVPCATQEEMRQNLAVGTTPRRIKSTLYTRIPTSYVDKVTKGDTIKVGLNFMKEKHVFGIRLSDANRPDITITCKCMLMKELDKLKLYRIELEPVRQMVTDISCLTKNIDLRLILCSIKILTVLKEEETKCIHSLIESVVLDPNIEGGLRWPLGKSTSDGRFSVCGVWHTINKVYANPSIKLKIRHVDRFDFRVSIGESTYEVFLSLKGVISLLQVPKFDTGLVSKELEDNLKLIWEHFLNCDNILG